MDNQNTNSKLTDKEFSVELKKLEAKYQFKIDDYGILDLPDFFPNEDKKLPKDAELELFRLLGRTH